MLTHSFSLAYILNSIFAHNSIYDNGIYTVFLVFPRIHDVYITRHNQEQGSVLYTYRPSSSKTGNCAVRFHIQDCRQKKKKKTVFWEIRAYTRHDPDSLTVYIYVRTTYIQVAN